MPEIEEQSEGVYLPPNQGRIIADDTLGSLQYQLDNHEIIREVTIALKCEQAMVQPNGSLRWVTPPGAIPMINNLGMSNIVACLKARLTKIMILSDLDQQMIQKIVCDIHEDITDDFYYNWEGYDIKDIATASLIIGIVTDTVYATLRKGHMGNYMKLLRSMHSIQEISQGQPRVAQSGASGEGISERLTNMLFRRRK